MPAAKKVKKVAVKKYGHEYYWHVHHRVLYETCYDPKTRLM